MTAFALLGAGQWASAQDRQRPSWLDLPVTDVATGETFTLGGFVGKTVYVEPMATWCTNCRNLMQSVKEAMARAGDADYVFVGLSVEAGLPDATLAAYATRWRFPLTYAVATPELLAALVRHFGGAIATPPATPHFVVQPDATVSPLRLGFESPDELLSLMWRSAGMVGEAPSATPWVDLDQTY